MQTRNMSATIIAILVSAGAAAGGNGPGTDGCAVLAEAIYDNIVTTRLNRIQGAASARYPGSISVRVCDQTARAVSAGFSRALNTMNLYVLWPPPEQQRGDVCLGVDLSQCFPDQHPPMPALGFYETAFILNSWTAVQGLVIQSMPNGVASDVSRFDRDAIGYQLQRRLQGISGDRLVTN